MGHACMEEVAGCRLEKLRMGCHEQAIPALGTSIQLNTEGVVVDCKWGFVQRTECIDLLQTTFDHSFSLKKNTIVYIYIYIISRTPTNPPNFPRDILVGYLFEGDVPVDQRSPA